MMAADMDRQSHRAVTGSLSDRTVTHYLTRPGGWNWILMVVGVGPMMRVVSKLKPPLGTDASFERVT